MCVLRSHGGVQDHNKKIKELRKDDKTRYLELPTSQALLLRLCTAYSNGVWAWVRLTENKAIGVQSWSDGWGLVAAPPALLLAYAAAAATCACQAGEGLPVLLGSVTHAPVYLLSLLCPSCRGTH